MGKGDIKTRKGKRFNSSFGNKRRRKIYNVRELIYSKNRHYRKRFNKKPSFKNTNHFQPITEFALALTAVKGQKYYPSGTAIIIAPFLALTAKHAVEDYFHKYDDIWELKGKDKIDGTFSMQAVQFYGNNKSGAIWNINQIKLCGNTDICYLILKPGSYVNEKKYREE